MSQKKKDLKLYFVAAAVEAPDQRILYVIDTRGGTGMLSEQQVRGRSGEVPLFAEKALREVIIFGSQITFQGVAEKISRKLIGAFETDKRAQECYATLDARSCDPRWTEDTRKALKLFGLASGAQCSRGEMRFAVGQ